MTKIVNKRKLEFGRAFTAWFIGWLLLLYRIFLQRTKIAVENSRNAWTMAKGIPPIYILWHARQITGIIYADHEEKVCTLASLSRDGEVQARIVQRLGIVAARGSSSRGGQEGLRELERLNNEGYVVTITTDGPRGPRWEVKQGAVELARRTGAAIVPIGVGTRRRRQIDRLWDRFHIPLPFGKAVCIFGEPHLVAPTATYEEMFEIRKALAEQLGKLNLEADHFCKAELDPVEVDHFKPSF